MPSPFPGMDPFLEGDDWTSFHTHFATEMARQLTPRLRPKYVALPKKRFDVVDEGALAVEMEAQAPHVWVEIREAAGRRLVTTIEILSPWNKRGQGREEYLRQTASSAPQLCAPDRNRSAAQRPPPADERRLAAGFVLRFRQPRRTAAHGPGVADRSRPSFADHPGTTPARRCRRRSRSAIFRGTTIIERPSR